MGALGITQNGADKFCFSLGVSLSVCGVRFSELRFERSIAGSKFGLLTQGVAEPYSFAPRFCAMHHDVKVMRAMSIGPAHEPLAITKCFIEFD